MTAAGGLDLLRSLVAGLVMIGSLVIVHEAGHFFAARLFGVAAPVFSIGFGPRLFGIQLGGTDYRLSAIPFGGYVRLAGADPFGEEDPDDVVEPGTDLTSRPIWQRLIVMAAGPLASLALPVVLFTAVRMAGEPEPDSVIGSVDPGRAGDQAGLRPGDRIVSVAGEPVATWLEAMLALGEHASDDPAVTVERDGQRFDVRFPPGTLKLGEEGYVDVDPLGVSQAWLSSRVGVDDPTSPAFRAGLRTGDAIVGIDGAPVKTWRDMEAGLAPTGPHTLKVQRAVDREITDLAPVSLAADPAWRPREGDPATDPYGLVPLYLFVGGVGKGGAAEAAGVLPDDRLWSVDGHLVRTWGDLVGLVGATVDQRTADAKPRALDLVVLRGGERHELTFTPTVTREVVLAQSRYRPVMGVARYPDVYVEGGLVKKRYGLFEAVPAALEDARLLLKYTVQTFSNMLTGDIKVSEGMGGPLEIFRVAAAGAKAGLYPYVRTMGAISLSLGFFNFLPVPVLDGGQILFYLVELVRGRPLSVELRERVQAVAILAIVALMLLVTVNDVGRLLGGPG